MTYDRHIIRWFLVLRVTEEVVHPREFPVCRVLAGLGRLPLGLAHNVKLLKPIKAGQSLTYADVVMDESLTAVKLRREMERDFAPAASKIAAQ